MKRVDIYIIKTPISFKYQEEQNEHFLSALPPKYASFWHLNLGCHVLHMVSSTIMFWQGEIHHWAFTSDTKRWFSNFAICSLSHDSCLYCNAMLFNLRWVRWVYLVLLCGNIWCSKPCHCCFEMYRNHKRDIFAFVDSSSFSVKNYSQHSCTLLPSATCNFWQLGYAHGGTAGMMFLSHYTGIQSLPPIHKFIRHQDSNISCDTSTKKKHQTWFLHWRACKAWDRRQMQHRTQNRKYNVHWKVLTRYSRQYEVKYANQGKRNSLTKGVMPRRSPKKWPRQRLVYW